MGRMITFTMILSILLLLFHFEGLIQNTPLSFILNVLLDPSSLKDHSWFSGLFAVLIAFSGASIVIGSFVSTRVEQGATIGFTALMFTAVLWDFVIFFNIVKQYFGAEWAALIVSPFILMFALTIVEWWRGKD